MGMVFEEVTGEVVSRRGDSPDENRAAPSHGPSEEQIGKVAADYAHLMWERCLRSLAD